MRNAHAHKASAKAAPLLQTLGDVRRALFKVAGELVDVDVAADPLPCEMLPYAGLRCPALAFAVVPGTGIEQAN